MALLANLLVIYHNLLCQVPTLTCFSVYSGYYQSWLPMAFWRFSCSFMLTGYSHLQIFHWQFGLHMSRFDFIFSCSLFTAIDHTFLAQTFVRKYRCINYGIQNIFELRCVNCTRNYVQIFKDRFWMSVDVCDKLENIFNCVPSLMTLHSECSVIIVRP